MKKILALVLALVMVLTVVSAMAAPSPQGPGKKTTTTTDTVVEEALQDAADTDGTKAIKEQLKKDADAGDALADVDVKLSEGYTEVTEMVTVKIPANSNVRTFKKAFQTPFKANSTVEILIGIPGDPVEWIKTVGVVNAAGEVVFTLTESDYQKVAGKEVVVVPVTKK